MRLAFTIIFILITLFCSCASAQYYGSSGQAMAVASGGGIIEKIDGPHHTYPHYGCLMCLGNHLIGNHGIPYDKLNDIGWRNWETFHDNLHNSGKEHSTIVKENTKPIFAPTPLDVVKLIIDWADLKSDQMLYDLGSGDGRIIIEAGKHCYAIGYEIQDKLVKVTQDIIKMNKLDNKVVVVKGDIFDVDLTDVDIVTLYLEPSINKKLVPQLNKMKSGSMIISYAHDVPLPKRGFKSEIKEFCTLDQKEHKVYIYRKK